MTTALTEEIDAIHQRLAQHPLFAAIETEEQLRRFMEWHVFAVWDFLSLLKRLQRELTCCQLPWTPSRNPRAARLINEIVLGEESDLLPDGSPLSHFELYLGAMREIGADTAQIEGFVEALRQGIALEAALARVSLPAPVAAFVRATLQCALQGDVEQVLGNFFHGRENIIPAMFSRLLKDWRIEPASAPLFVHYIRRHIELDQGEHGPAAEAIIAELIGGRDKAREQMLQGALAALRQREALWNALLSHLQGEGLRNVAE